MKKIWIVEIIIIIVIFLLYFISTSILNQKINETILFLKSYGYATTLTEIKPKSTVEGKRAAKLLTNAYQEMRIEDKAERNIAAQQSAVADSINYKENPQLFKKFIADNTKAIDLLLEAVITRYCII
jgi:hypothetical protein